MMYAVIVGLGILIAVLVGAIFRLGKDDFQLLANRMADKSRQQFGVLKPCPLCGSLLERGQKVRTKVFSVEQKGRQKPNAIQDSLVHMFGCPHCDPRDNRPAEDPQILPGPGQERRQLPKRICPACSQELGPADHVVARMFEQEGKKPHLHVLGCTRCRR